MIIFNFAYIRRELEDHILKGTLRNRAELILGPRQVGKSTMLDHLVQNQRFIKLSGEDDDDLSILADPKTFLTLTQQFPNVIIDEAQFVPNIGRVIKRMVDNNTTDSRIFVTGSSALDLGGHLKESAAGRFNSYNLWPLSLEELAEHSSWIEVKRQINDRMIYGCHPDVINDPAHAKEYLLDFTDSILYKDLFKLTEVRKPTDLTKLVKFLAANVGSEIRYGSIASELGIQNKTIERYVDLLASCFILKVVPSWTRNPTAELKLSKKIYFYDNGIRNALLKNFTPVPAREDKGALWENLFFTERLKLHAFRRDGGEIYIWRTKKQHEMDFIEIVNGTIAAFECKAGNKTNFNSIRAFTRAYPNIPVTVVSPDNIDQEPAAPAILATAFDAPPSP
ncbi:ATP-binding protein [Duodenibacillus massiliensis]|uniref:ATP-binding protein n=1 Tax=Duodenibacillus massiliensis TaxID=1852381 RepID=UPI003076B86B